MRQHKYLMIGSLLAAQMLISACGKMGFDGDVLRNTSPKGTLLQLHPGWNCYEESCFILDSLRRTVQSTEENAKPVAIPEDYLIADGAVSPREFAYLYRIARSGEK